MGILDVPGLSAANANATYVSMAQAQIGTDTDGVPYFASGLAFASSVPVKTDTDGVPYIAA